MVPVGVTLHGSIQHPCPGLPAPPQAATLSPATTRHNELPQTQDYGIHHAHGSVGQETRCSGSNVGSPGWGT